MNNVSSYWVGDDEINMNCCDNGWWILPMMIVNIHFNMFNDEFDFF